MQSPSAASTSPSSRPRSPSLHRGVARARPGLHLPTGRAWAEDLDYPADLLARVPETACASFAGVANPFSLGALTAGEDVSIWVGRRDGQPRGQPDGRPGWIGHRLDMTPAMLDRARRAASELGASNVRFVEGQAEDLPFDDASFDVVISNGVIDLIPDKDAVFDELFRVLRPGGRLQLADVTIQRPVSEEGRRNIDLWTG